MDRKELIQLKKDTVSRLRDIDIAALVLDSTDKRLTEYVTGCIANPDKHNLS